MVVDYYGFWENQKGESFSFKILSDFEKLIDGNDIGFKDWVVTKDLDLVRRFENGREYWIERDMLLDHNWVAHLLKKEWCDMNTFVRAYYFALERCEVDLYRINYINKQ